MNYRAVDARTLQEMEPHLAPVLSGALHWTDPVSVDDPQGLAHVYLRLFERLDQPDGPFLGAHHRTAIAPGGFEPPTSRL